MSSAAGGSVEAAAAEADEARRELEQTMKSYLPTYMPEAQLKPRFHHIRFNDYERYELWHKTLAESTAVSVDGILNEDTDDLAVSHAYDDMAEYARDALAHVEVVIALRSMRALPVPNSLELAAQSLSEAGDAWGRAAEAAPSGRPEGEAVAAAVEAAVAGQALAREALLDMCPSLRGDAVAGIGPDAQWSEAALADLQVPGELTPLPEGDERLSSRGVVARSVPEWRLALSRALAGIEAASTCTLVHRSRPSGRTASRAYEEHAAGADAAAPRWRRAQSALASGRVASAGERDGRVAGPEGLVPGHIAAQRERLEWDPAARGDAWTRKTVEDAANELALATQPWQTRRVAGRLSDGAPSHLRRVAEGLEKGTTHTAGQRARLLQEAANALDQAKELTERDLTPADLARMEAAAARPSADAVVKPWNVRFPVSTRDPSSGRPAEDALFKDDGRPEERDPYLPDGAEHDAVHGAASPSAADITAIGRAQRDAASLSRYHAFLARVSKPA